MTESGYQVLARRWRPLHLDDVIGQDAIVRTLANALEQGRIAHAYLFSGIRGVGKTTMARLLAKGLNCHEFDGPTSKPCGACASCREIDDSRSMDVVELDAASQTGVDDIRELTEFTRYAAVRDRRRVFIIDEAHMLSPNAFNALLKTLEEPPPHVVFVLATTEPNKVLPTVLSRCQQYHFRRIGQLHIAGQLRRIADDTEHPIEITDDSIALLAVAADGSLRDAQSLFDKVISFGGEKIDESMVVDLLGVIDRMLLHRVTELIAGRDLPGVLGFVDELVEQGVNLHQFCIDLLGHFRNLAIVQAVEHAGEILHLPQDDIGQLREQADRFELDDIDRAFSLLAASEYRIKNADQPRYHLEMTLARLARMPHLQPLADVIAELRAGPAEPAGPVPGSGAGGAPEERPKPRPRTRGRPETARPRDRDGEPRSGPATQGTRDEPPHPATSAISSPRPNVGNGDGNALLEALKERVYDTRPVVAGILDRTLGATLEAGTLALVPPANGGIFAARLADADVLRELCETAGAVAGRTIRIEVAEPQQQPDADAGVPTPAEAIPFDADLRESSGPGRGDGGGSRGAAGAAGRRDRASSGRARAEDAALRGRAEEEPLVQGFLRALKGQIVKVEEP